MRIIILIYDGMTALDAIGPYEVLSRLPGVELTFVGLERGPVVADTKALRLMADLSIDDVDRADILLVPGGPGTGALGRDPRLKAWLNKIHATTTYTCTVCTGALIAAEAGILDGVRSTTYWARIDALQALGVVALRERVVVDGKHYSAAGVSAGIDMALTLVRDMLGPTVAQAIQLGIEYDPAPPFDTGAPDKVTPEILAIVQATLDA